MLKQFISDRDKKIEHLIAELEKAKAHAMGGSSFKKYVQLKSQNVELQDQVHSLSKQVHGNQNGGRGGRRAAGRQNQISENNSLLGAMNGERNVVSTRMNPSSLATDSIGSDFADDRGGRAGTYFCEYWCRE